MIRKTIATLAITIGLTLGIAQPASAHHTHSPTTFCNGIQWFPDRLYRAFTSVYNIYGHPVRVNCVITDSATERRYFVKYSYSTHDTMAYGWCSAYPREC